MPERIQLSRAKGWRMPPNTVKVDRSTKWGNPYRVDVFGLQLAMELFRESAHGYWNPSNVAHLSDELAAEAYRCHTALRRQLQQAPVWMLRGKNLACWCKLDQPCCHADVLLELANAAP
jgi:hypothetical protein